MIELDIRRLDRRDHLVERNITVQRIASVVLQIQMRGDEWPWFGPAEGYFSNN